MLGKFALHKLLVCIIGLRERGRLQARRLKYTNFWILNIHTVLAQLMLLASAAVQRVTVCLFSGYR
jgi:hypothetical protein